MENTGTRNPEDPSLLKGIFFGSYFIVNSDIAVRRIVCFRIASNDRLKGRKSTAWLAIASANILISSKIAERGHENGLPPDIRGQVGVSLSSVQLLRSILKDKFHRQSSAISSETP